MSIEPTSESDYASSDRGPSVEDDDPAPTGQWAPVTATEAAPPEPRLYGDGGDDLSWRLRTSGSM